MQIQCLADGTVGEVKVINGLGFGLDEVAIKAVREMLFLPAVKDGEFTTSWTPGFLDFGSR